MLRSSKNYLSKIPPQGAIISALFAVVAVAGILYLLSRSEPTADADFVPRAARIERVDGNVDVARTLTDPNITEPAWEDAVRNAPLAVGDRVYAREGSRATVALTGRNYARLDSGSALDVLSLADRRTQLALRDGSAIFDVGEIADGELFEVATPNGAVDFYEPGLYQVGIGDDGNSWVSVLSGLAQVVGLAGSGQVGKGEILTLVGQTAAQALLSRMSPDLAGGLVDDYYGYRYPNSYDGRYRNYSVYQDDPDYYDPYRRSVSYRYVADDIPGVYDLDSYGDWSDIDGYGHCWTPRVDSSWAPYRDGYWDEDNVYGPTWISRESWGWAPYHYGRWAYVNNRQWVWVPDRARTHSSYAPALVAFVPLTRSNQIGWVPLAPGEAYLPRYYDAGYQPQYFSSPGVVTVQRTFINAGYPQAVTVVPVQDFTRVINPRMIANVNPQWIAETQPVLDPYAIDSLRSQAISRKEEKRRLKMERALNNQVFNTPVVTSATPIALPGRTDASNALQVATVPEKQKKQKIKFNDSGQIVTARNKGGELRPLIPQPNASDVAQQRGERIAALKTQATQGDKTARREMKQLKREQRLQERGIVANPAPAITHTQPDAARSERKAQKRLERQQRVTVQQKTVQQNQPRFNQQQPASNVERQQRKAQKRLERQQQSAATGQVQRPQTYADQQVREQRKAQKRAVREQRVNQQSVNQQQLMIEQQKQRVVVQQTEKQQRKAERRAVRQQQVRPQAPEQIRVQPRVEYKGPPANQGAAEAQRRAAKAERKAARKNQQ